MNKLKECQEIEYLGEVIEHSWGQRVIRFYDLDGHLIEVGEDMKMVKMLEDSIFLIHQQARPDYFNSQAWYTKEEFEELLMLLAPISLVAVCDEQIVGICFGKIEQTSGNSFCKGRKINCT